MQSGLLSTIHLLGVIQGMILCVFLVFRKQNTLANRVLGIWLALFSLNLLELVLAREGYYQLESMRQ